MKIATSNTSTLISFYRTETFYPLLKSLFSHILIPNFCWNEMISGTDVDRKFADRVRLINDKDTFLLIKKPTKKEEKDAKSFY